jgi:hypothetical protein
MEPGGVDLTLLTTAQDNAADGLLAQAMAGFLRSLAPRIDTLKKDLQIRHRELRTEIRSLLPGHPRTPDLVASLLLGWDFLLEFAYGEGALTLEKAEKLRRIGHEALLEAGRAQDAHQASEDPVIRFLQLLQAAIASGSAHLVSAYTGAEPIVTPEAWGWRKDTFDEMRPCGHRIGWVEETQIRLEPDAAFRAVQMYARDQGASMPVTQKTLWKRLAERGFIIGGAEPGRNSHKWWAPDQIRPRVLVMQWPPLGLETGAIGAFGASPFEDEAPLPPRRAAHRWQSQPIGAAASPEPSAAKPPARGSESAAPVAPMAPLSELEGPGFRHEVGKMRDALIQKHPNMPEETAQARAKRIVSRTEASLDDFHAAQLESLKDLPPPRSLEERSRYRQAVGHRTFFPR